MTRISTGRNNAAGAFTNNGAIEKQIRNDAQTIRTYDKKRAGITRTPAQLASNLTEGYFTRNFSGNSITVS